MDFRDIARNELLMKGGLCGVLLLLLLVLLLLLLLLLLYYY